MSTSWHPTAQTDDANYWTAGRCWLYCRRENVRVTWVGPASTPNGSRPMYACASCIAELDYMVRDELHRQDLGKFTRQHPTHPVSRSDST